MIDMWGKDDEPFPHFLAEEASPPRLVPLSPFADAVPSYTALPIGARDGAEARVVPIPLLLPFPVGVPTEPWWAGLGSVGGVCALLLCSCGGSGGKGGLILISVLLMLFLVVVEIHCSLYVAFGQVEVVLRLGGAGDAEVEQGLNCGWDLGLLGLWLGMWIGWWVECLLWLLLWLLRDVRGNWVRVVRPGAEGVDLRW